MLPAMRAPIAIRPRFSCLISSNLQPVVLPSVPFLCCNLLRLTIRCNGCNVQYGQRLEALTSSLVGKIQSWVLRLRKEVLSTTHNPQPQNCVLLFL